MLKDFKSYSNTLTKNHHKKLDLIIIDSIFGINRTTKSYSRKTYKIIYFNEPNNPMNDNNNNNSLSKK